MDQRRQPIGLQQIRRVKTNTDIILWVNTGVPTGPTSLDEFLHPEHKQGWLISPHPFFVHYGKERGQNKKLSFWRISNIWLCLGSVPGTDCNFSPLPVLRRPAWPRGLPPWTQINNLNRPIWSGGKNSSMLPLVVLKLTGKQALRRGGRGGLSLKRWTGWCDVGWPWRMDGVGWICCHDNSRCQSYKLIWEFRGCYFKPLISNREWLR